MKIYKLEFQTLQLLSRPYTIAVVNVYVTDTDEEVEKLFTSLIRMFVGVSTGARDPLDSPTDMTEELKEMFHHPAVNQMLKYSFV